MHRSGGHPERRQQILDAALRVFSERGYGGASIRGISSVAGLNSPPLVYWYFESKEDLFAEVLAHFSRRAPGFRFGDQMDRPPETVLPELAREELRAFEDEALVRLLRVAVAEAAMDPAAGDRFFGVLRGETLDFLTRYFELWGRRREAVDFEPGTEARVFFGSLVFYVLNCEVLPGFGGLLPDGDAYTDYVVRQVLERLGAGGDRTPAMPPVPGRALPPALTQEAGGRGRR
jgi:AcrR family transcriptional regulator